MSATEEAATAGPPGVLVTTASDLDRLPAGSVVRSSAGTIACRFDGRNGVVFGDERPFPWHQLALPAQVLWRPDGDVAASAPDDYPIGLVRG